MAPGIVWPFPTFSLLLCWNTSAILTVIGEEQSAAVRCVRWCNGVVLHIAPLSGLQVSSGSLARCTGRVLRSLFIGENTRGMDSSQKSVNSKLDPCVCCFKNRLATEFQKEWKTVVTEITTGMLYLWYKSYCSLSIPNVISLRSFFFSTFPAVFFQVSFPEWEMLPQKVCWNRECFCISLKTHIFLDIHKPPSSSQADCWVVPFC